MNDAVLAAIEDARLPRKTVRIYIHLTKSLDLMDYRKVKVSWLAKTAGVHRITAVHALKHLREAGYIIRGPRVENAYTYRLAYSPSPKV